MIPKGSRWTCTAHHQHRCAATYWECENRAAMLECLRRWTRVKPDDDPVVIFAMIEQTRALLARLEG